MTTGPGGWGNYEILSGCCHCPVFEEFYRDWTATLWKCTCCGQYCYSLIYLRKDNSGPGPGPAIEVGGGKNE